MAEKPEDLSLPNAVIARIMKEALPDGVIISKEARQAISKAASVFVLYCTSCANNNALQNKRKILKDVDILTAVEEMDFEGFIPSLKQSLAAFKLGQKEKKEASEKRKKLLKDQQNAAKQEAENAVAVAESNEESMSIESDAVDTSVNE